MHVCVCVCVCVCVRICTQAHKHTHMKIHAYRYVRTSVHVRYFMYGYLCLCAYTHPLIHTHTRIHTQTHTHTEPWRYPTDANWRGRICFSVCTPCMFALYDCLACLPCMHHMFASDVRLTFLPYMCRARRRQPSSRPCLCGRQGRYVCGHTLCLMKNAGCSSARLLWRTDFGLAASTLLPSFSCPHPPSCVCFQ